ncbi:MAG: hypothetical protein JWL70_818 [Acidimicrobiia bacterium]|nr:hypothetical protein [Acidimicrobiia bacterium]
MPPPGSTPANWYPDPTSRHEHRYWDGTGWTDHVSDHGVQATDPVAGPPVAEVVSINARPEQIASQVTDTGLRGAGITPGTALGGGTVFTEPILVVNQKAKLIELTNQYAVFDQAGNQVASVTEVGQSKAKKALRLLSSLDQFMSHRLEVNDMNGAVILQLTRPAKVFKSTVVVSDGAGTELGRIVQENMIGKIHFGLEANGQTVGAIKAENWRAWNFRIEDASGTEVARITKTWEGLAKTMFTTADNYVVQLHTDIAQPLLTLVVASALSVDTALKQDSRGFN